LAGLMIGLGVIVDDAIVYTSSLFRRMRRGPGTSFAHTIREAFAGVRSSLVFATVIALLAAVPALFVAGSPGALINPMVLSYGAAVLASLLVAITLTPALTMLLFQNTDLVRHETRFAS